MELLHLWSLRDEKTPNEGGPLQKDSSWKMKGGCLPIFVLKPYC